ncbi:hypothetical protein HPB49_006253 [Dermacentor silvarum]|uniref:Uncharacterized protein n=1 Tax=Dermacentor silvarum TaxID=543639 RepID=A0ACB8CJJ3_DERSI|nr:hypothetical protein HPB49_006253 [Dermacentor silvarum]
MTVTRKTVRWLVLLVLDIHSTSDCLLGNCEKGCRVPPGDEMLRSKKNDVYPVGSTFSNRCNDETTCGPDSEWIPPLNYDCNSIDGKSRAYPNVSSHKGKTLIRVKRAASTYDVTTHISNPSIITTIADPNTATAGYAFQAITINYTALVEAKNKILDRCEGCRSGMPPPPSFRYAIMAGDGRDAAYVWHDGYLMRGTPILKCDDAGRWSGTQPECSEEPVSWATQIAMVIITAAVNGAMVFSYLCFCRAKSHTYHIVRTTSDNEEDEELTERAVRHQCDYPLDIRLDKRSELLETVWTSPLSNVRGIESCDRLVRWAHVPWSVAECARNYCSFMGFFHVRLLFEGGHVDLYHVANYLPLSPFLPDDDSYGILGRIMVKGKEKLFTS